MAPRAIEERLGELSDREAIRSLFHTYGRCLDTKDWEGLGGLFADDGELVAALGAARGPEQIRSRFESTLADVPSGHHVFTNISIDVDRDTATAQSKWLYLCPADNGWPKMLQFGHYHDVLVRRDGRWLFQRREAARDIGFPPYSR
jgi:uncharacterized protein (TIGR02246 family)